MPISIYRTDGELIATVEDAETIRDAVIALTKKGINLEGANLYGANLEGARLDGARLPTGETFEEYVSTILPALLTLGGKSLDDVVTASWDCHKWSNCPMHFAFDFDGSYSGAFPLVKLMRPRIEQFVQLFDKKLLPIELLVASIPQLSELEIAKEQPATEGGAT